MALLLMPACAQGEDLLKLQNGDRVILLGSTLIEREQRSGYWETALAVANPGVSYSVRNLGWSGDTVWADSRAGFGTPEDGFREMQQLIGTLKPTLIIVCYGFNESFAGEAGIPKFREGLKRLKDMLAENKVRLVFVAPPEMEFREGPFPNPVQNNQNLALYRDAIQEFARVEGVPFADWLESVIPPAGQNPIGEAEALTDNGLHLTDRGYWRTSGTLAGLTGTQPEPANVEIDLASKKINGPLITTDVEWSPTGVKFRGTFERLPACMTLDFPGSPISRPQVIRLSSLEVDKDYRLVIDGAVVATGKGEAWANGLSLSEDPALKQVEELRQVVLRKNELFFHRWRPQNVTYLFGFRKHEQGQNAREVAEFEPLVQKQDELIDQLKRPRGHQFELQKVSSKGGSK